ncbi:TfoX/Sxy family protein [Rhodococcus sp. G-MC3]|uniref:TfoX/Sxy family protein n=1 Tax=Rhodococcus sp. G-MC3 TaxID=3046209 RepID=UPI0024BBCB63|nr:TfoX/Sxy family protein [Rhodococcus sp. G-MC3]MDJ0393606.1 TfoX/Sxy family protein [Rhodococcus sp. G-MC3]
MTYDVELADRIRYALSGEPSVVEKKMFGGLQFMVRGKLAAGATVDGRLLLKCDPSRSDELTAHPGARTADMGGRDMGKSWIAVDPEGLSDADLTWWIGVALEFNESSAR